MATVQRYVGLSDAVRALRLSAPAAPVVSVTATGPIRLESGKLFVAPAQVGLSRMHDLHLQASGGASRVRFADVSAMTSLRAFRSYSNAVVCALAQLTVAPGPSREALLSQVLDFADTTGSLAGIEGVFLTAVRATQLTGNEALLQRAQETWAHLDVGEPIGGGALTVPVLDVGTDQLAFLTAAELTGMLGMGLDSPNGYTVIDVTSELPGLSGQEGLTFGGSLDGLSGLAGLGGLGGTGRGLNILSGSGERGFGPVLGPHAFDGLSTDDLLGGDGFAGKGFGGADQSPGDTGAAIGGKIGGALGLVGGALAGGLAAAATGPGAPAAAPATVVFGATVGAAAGWTAGTHVGEGVGWIIGWIADSGPAPPPAPSPAPSGGGDTPRHPTRGGSGPAPSGGSGPAPSGGGDRPGGHSGGDGRTGGQSSGWHPPMPLPDDQGDRDLDDEYGQGGRGGISAFNALIPSGPGLASLTSYQGGTSFLVNALPQVGPDGRVDFGYLGATGEALYSEAAGGSGDLLVPSGRTSSGRTSLVALPDGGLTTQPNRDQTLETLASLASQLLTLAKQLRTG